MTDDAEARCQAAAARIRAHWADRCPDCDGWGEVIGCPACSVEANWPREGQVSENEWREWAVRYEDGSVEVFRDRVEAEHMAAPFPGDEVVCRDVTATPWRRP